MKINTISLIEKLKTIIFPDGFELSVRHGILSSTKAIYLKDELIYLFNMEDEFDFNPKQFGYSEYEFLKEYGNYFWTIEELA